MTIDELKKQIALCRFDRDEAEALVLDNERSGRAGQFNKPYLSYQTMVGAVKRMTYLEAVNSVIEALEETEGEPNWRRAGEIVDVLRSSAAVPTSGQPCTKPAAHTTQVGG